MDVHAILESKIEALPPGAHLDGLRSVKLHIDRAVKHFDRGQKEADESLFTDVIFRCNQAFEGSIKEAYRVIAGKDPQKESIANIEKFLSTGGQLRKKVLNQFTRYRQEWRNPSTHDYTLDFDENEALLAVVTVTAFAIVLCDEIESKLAFDAASTAPARTTSTSDKDRPLLELVATKALTFASTHVDEVGPTQSPAHDYYRLEGALAGYLTAELASIPGLTVAQNRRFASREADIVVERESQKLIIELKRYPRAVGVRTVVRQAITQAAFYLHEENVIGALVLIYSMEKRTYEVKKADEPLENKILIVAPTAE